MTQALTRRDPLGATAAAGAGLAAGTAPAEVAAERTTDSAEGGKARGAMALRRRGGGRLAMLTAALLVAAVIAPAAAAVAAPRKAPELRVGVGRADVTPPVRGFFGGWANEDAVPRGVHTRLFARAIVLERGGKKVALVSADLSYLSNGLLEEAVALLPGRGITAQNTLVSASHTHGGPNGYMNFSSYNSVLPTTRSVRGETAVEPVPEGFEKQLHTFVVRRLALALQRADDDRAPGYAGWGSTRLRGPTRNRSLEGHLGNHGVLAPRDQGTLAQDPLGEADTLDPEVDVLRVDQLQRGRRVPVGIWSSFANHGTANRFSWAYLGADHYGPAARVAEAAIRRLGKVPRGQDVVNAYAAGALGDQSSGLTRFGPAVAEEVGRAEGRAMVTAWKAAGGRLSGAPALDVRWTRSCFCGSPTAQGPVDTQAIIGIAAGAGSEEARTIFTDATGVNYEGQTLPAPVGAQGVKVPTLDQTDSTPGAVPFTVVRVGGGAIASVPGEPTAEMGRRVRAAVRTALAPAGVTQVAIAGLGNEYLSYFATPEEYDRQHYEGGFTLYGRTASVLVQERLVALASALAAGAPAPAAQPFDATNGMRPDAEPFGPGGASGRITKQPAAIQRLQRATFAWTGGPAGEDRPLDAAFVSVQRRGGSRFRTVTNDLGLQIAWTTNAAGEYAAAWEAPLDATPGTYRVVVTANRYRLESAAFEVRPSTRLGLRAIPGRRAVELTYPEAKPDVDFTFRPVAARGGSATFVRDGVSRTVRTRASMRSFADPLGSGATIAAGAARDRHGNTNASALTLP